MDPITIGILAASAGSAIWGGISKWWGSKKEEEAKKAEQRRIAEEKKAHQAWYDREYYQNPLETEEARAAQAQAREYLNDSAKKDDQMATMTGASEEAKVARRGQQQKAWADMVRGLSAKGTDYKKMLNSQYIQGNANLSAQQSNLAGQDIAYQQQRQASGDAMIQNGLALGGQAIAGMGAKSSPNPTLMNAQPMQTGLGFDTSFPKNTGLQYTQPIR